MPSRTFCLKFDDEKLLFGAFLGIMRIFGRVQPKSKSLLFFILSRSNRILVSSVTSALLQQVTSANIYETCLCVPPLMVCIARHSILESVGYGHSRYSGIPMTSCFVGCIVSEPTLLFVITLTLTTYIISEKTQSFKCWQLCITKVIMDNTYCYTLK